MLQELDGNAGGGAAGHRGSNGPLLHIFWTAGPEYGENAGNSAAARSGR